MELIFTVVVIILAVIVGGYFRIRSDNRRVATAQQILAELPGKIAAADAVELPDGSSAELRRSGAKTVYKVMADHLVFAAEWDKARIYLLYFTQLQAAAKILEEIIASEAAA